MEVRMADAGDMVSVGEVRSVERMLLCRLVCDVARARREEGGCLVWIRRGCDITGLEVVPVSEGVRFERFEVERKA
jgi:hypothetical protein